MKGLGTTWRKRNSRIAAIMRMAAKMAASLLLPFFLRAGGGASDVTLATTGPSGLLKRNFSALLLSTLSGLLSRTPKRVVVVDCV
jgi:hypothetical protein